MVQIISQKICESAISKTELLEKYSKSIQNIILSVLKVVPFEEKEDLISVANIGLIEAYNRFSAERNCCLWSYAKPRILGAIKDYLRKNDPLTRVQRQNIKLINKSITELIIKNGEYPNDFEISEMSGLPFKKVVESKLINNAIRFISFELYKQKENGTGISKLPHDTNNPEKLMDFKERLTIIKRLIDELPEKESMIMNFLYFKGYSINRTAKELGLSEGRISQVRKSIIKKLKNAVIGFC